MQNPEAIIDEVRSEKVTLICGRHKYTPTKRRANHTIVIPPHPNGCKDCWLAYYIADLAFTQPGKRQERLDELEQVIHHTVEYEKQGRFGKDFELYEPSDSRFQVEYQKDAADDKTGEDKIPGEEKS